MVKVHEFKSFIDGKNIKIIDHNNLTRHILFDCLFIDIKD